MVRFADDPAVRHRIAFLPDYDIAMARYLYWGVDVWLNNPLRPLEACGTSGMKAALNGALNLSIRDGWWDEWFDGENGWAIPSADGINNADRRDDLEARALYELIEGSVAPRFYDRDSAGIPARWVQMVRHTLTTLSPKVLATRMVIDYVEKLYAPAAASARLMRGSDFAAAKQLSAWRKRTVGAWPGVRVLYVDSQLEGSAEIGSVLSLRAEVALNGLSPDDVQVEAVFGPVDVDDRLTQPQTTPLKAAESVDGTTYFTGEVPLERTGAFGYTVRVLPHKESLATAAELGLIVTA
jgi:starch phosphorylase